MSDVTPRQPVKQAHAIRNECSDLINSPGWPWFAGLMKERMDDLTRTVMETELSDAARERSIREYQTIKQWMELPREQIEAQKRTIEAKHGARGPDPDAE